MATGSTAAALIRACHPEPTVAVTTLAGLLAVSAGNDPATLVLLVFAVLTGQLTIGWSNDLTDLRRDRLVGRADKPLATGQLEVPTVRAALAVATVACLIASAALGVSAGLAHLLLVCCGWAYNLGLKRTMWSWLPYAIAFGALPAVAYLALDPPVWPPVWMMAAGSLLGVGAHLVNALPDLADDAATGVRGLPHRLGRSRAQLAAIAILVTASVIAVLGPGTPPVWGWAGLGVVAILAGVGLRGRGKAPFRAALAIAAVDVVMLVLRG